MTRKQIKTLAILLFVVIFSFTTIYFMSVNKVETLIHKFVANQSDGNISLEIGKINFNTEKFEFQVSDINFQTTDSLHTNTGYKVSVNKTNLKLKSLWSLLSDGFFIVDTIQVTNPIVKVIKYNTKSEGKVLVAQEIKNVYEWLSRSVNYINLNHLRIQKAEFEIVNSRKISSRPIKINNINLIIEDISLKKDFGDKKFMFAQNLILELGKQNIEFSNDNSILSFKKFKLETHSQTIKLDSCEIISKFSKRTTNTFNIALDSIFIHNLDFNLLALNSTLKFDSAICFHPNIQVELNIRKRVFSSSLHHINHDSLTHALSKMTGKLIAGFIMVKDAKIRVDTKQRKLTSRFSTEKSNFSLKGVSIDERNHNHLKIDEINFTFENYTGNLLNNLFGMKFDKVSIINNNIILYNLSILPSKKNKESIRKSIKVKTFALNNINWLDLIFRRKIHATQATFIEPEIKIHIPKGYISPTPSSNKFNLFRSMDNLKKSIMIDKFTIQNGCINYMNDNGTSILSMGCNVRISTNKLLAASDMNKLFKAIDIFEVKNTIYNTKENSVEIQNANFSKTNCYLNIKKLNYNSLSQNTNACINNISLKNFNLESKKTLAAENLEWSNATINIDSEDQIFIVKNNSKPLMVDLAINQFSMHNTQFFIKKKEMELKGNIELLKLTKITFENLKKLAINNLKLYGKDFSLKKDNRNKLEISEILINDNETISLKHTHLNTVLKNFNCLISVPKIAITFDLEKILSRKFDFNNVEIESPQIDVQKCTPIFKKPDYCLKNKQLEGITNFSIHKLSFINPQITHFPWEMGGDLEIFISKSKYVFNEIIFSNNELNINGMNLYIENPTLKFKQYFMNHTQNKSTICANLKKFNLTKELDWNIELEEMKCRNVMFTKNNRNAAELNLFLENFESSRLLLSNKVLKSGNIFNSSPQFSISHTSASLYLSKNRVSISNFSYLNEQNKIELDSLEYTPVVNQYEFMKEKEFQTTYSFFKTGKLVINKINLPDILRSKQLIIHKIDASNLYYHGYKDKRLALKHGVVKPLPTELITRIPIKLWIDSLIIRNSTINYQEMSAKTLQLGEINVYKLGGIIKNIRNFDLKEKDSLTMNLAANFMNTTNIKVNYKQSYTDSLSTFQLNIIAGKADLTKLNPVLKPFASALITSGTLDTIRLSAIGRKYVAFGIMKMYYRNLNIIYLDQKTKSRTTPAGKFISFVANLILKGNNLYGSKEVFAERNSELGFINYWLKILIGGSLTNTGIQSNRTTQKRYNKSLKRHNVPAIKDIPVGI